VTMSQYTIPTVVERTSAGERAFDIYSRLLSERIVFLGTEIDDGVANVIMAQLLHLEAASPDLEISLYINSPGGSYSALTAIYDTMQYIRPDVATICMGQASSAAAVLLAAGAIADATAPWLIGRLRDTTGTYSVSCIVLVGLALLGGLAVLGLPGRRRAA